MAQELRIGCGAHAIANIFSTLHLMRQPIQAVSARHLNRAQAAAARLGIPGPTTTITGCWLRRPWTWRTVSSPRLHLQLRGLA